MITENKPVKRDCRMLDLKGSLKGNVTTTSHNYGKTKKHPKQSNKKTINQQKQKMKHQHKNKGLSCH